MKRSFWITLTISAAACCLLLFIQGQHNERLADRVDSRRTVSENKTPKRGDSGSRPKSAVASTESTIDEARVASALANVERLTAELGVAGASLNEQIAAMAAAMESGTPAVDLEKFETRVPELLKLVENFNLDEIIALAEKAPKSQAKTFLVKLAAEQDPLRILGNKSLRKAALVSETYVLDALARTNPAAALQRLKGDLEADGSVPKGDKTRMRRYAALMMQDDVMGGLRELMWIQDIEDTDTMAMTKFDRPTLEGVDTAQLVEAMDDPEFAEIRNDIISMTLDHQLIGEGVTAVAQMAQSMSLTQQELTNHMNALIENDIMASQPQATLAWIADAQPPETQLRMVPRAFLEWSKTDATGARDWLGEQRESPLRDKTIANFAKKAPNLDRQSAAQWTLQIQEEGTRNSTLRTVVDKWRREDAAAANTWLGENGIEL